jgi:hypothetical protein
MLSVYVCTPVPAMSAFEQVNHVHEIWHERYAVGGHSNAILSMALQFFVGPWPFFSFLILCTVGRTPWMGDQAVARPLRIHRTTQTQNKPTQTSMPRVRFEATTPVFEQAKTVHVLDCAATVIGPTPYYLQ